MTVKQKYFPLIMTLFFVTIIGNSCKKYLDEKPDRSLKVPSTIADLQALLDLGSFMNGNSVSFDEASVDNYYLPSGAYNSLGPYERYAYSWQNKPYTKYPNDWSIIYDVINVANITLDNIEKIEHNEQNLLAWNNVKGSALFFRAYSLLQGAFVFCKAYDKATAGHDLGMVLRLTSNMNAASKRSSVAETYDRIIADLKAASVLLPPLPQHVMRPSKAAAYGMLARTYLSMQLYDSCAICADLSLSLKDDLIDFNTIDINARKPFSRQNEEVVFDAVIGRETYFCMNPGYSKVDSLLYKSYDENDLRKIAFFSGTAPSVSFKGTYSNDLYEIYVGLTTDELYLMRAESYVRQGNTNEAVEALNKLMRSRWKDGLFTPFEASSVEETLQLILTERRKELIWRGLRWMDIKRLNKEGANIVLSRTINGETYTLLPNDNRYALPLPDDIIKMTGMQQNSYQ